MDKPRPFLVKALIVAVVFYVIGTTLLLNDLYKKVGDLEHDAMHAKMGTTCQDPEKADLNHIGR